jgi:hypothetical protein
MQTKWGIRSLVGVLTAAFAVATAATAATPVYYDLTNQAQVHPVTSAGSATPSGATSTVYYDL